MKSCKIKIMDCRLWRPLSKMMLWTIILTFLIGPASCFWGTDKTPPVITLNGEPEMTVLLDSTFVDPGATAEDDKDGPVDVVVTGSVDTSLAGEYVLTYTATDSAGNSASVTRKVTVIEPAETNKASLGMGLNDVTDYGTALPFIDLMKQARRWQDWDNGSTDIDDTQLDENDWVLYLNQGQTAGTVFLALAPEAIPFDRVIVLYEGEGVLRYSWSCHLVEHVEEGKDLVSVSGGASLLTIMETNPGNPIRNIRIIPEPYMDEYEAGQVFNPDWLALVDRFRAIRFMTWMKTNETTQESWEERPLPGHRTWRINGGVPLEIMIRLANLINANPWFNIPHTADIEYMEHFARMVKDNLNPNLSVYVEHSNEVWNWGFPQAHYAEAAAFDRWGVGGDGFIQWHGMRTAMACDAFKKGAFADQADRVKCVLGVQAAYHGLEDGSLNCPLWVAEGNEPCYQHGIDYVGITTYFSGGLNGPRPWDSEEQQLLHESTLRSWFTDADGGLSKAFQQLNDGSLLTDITKYQNFTGIVDELHGELNYWSGIGDQYGLGIVAYEGGQHITANGLSMQGDEDFVTFHLAVNRDARMKQIYTDLFNTFKDYGGKLHMNYVEMGSHSQYGSWGVLEHHNQSTSPRWEAIVDFNSTVECWWEGCAF